jgi:hypothetical protein
MGLIRFLYDDGISCLMPVSISTDDGQHMIEIAHRGEIKIMRFSSLPLLTDDRQHLIIIPHPGEIKIMRFSSLSLLTDDGQHVIIIALPGEIKIMRFSSLTLLTEDGQRECNSSPRRDKNNEIHIPVLAHR